MRTRVQPGTKALAMTVATVVAGGGITVGTAIRAAAGPNSGPATTSSHPSSPFDGTWRRRPSEIDNGANPNFTINVAGHKLTGKVHWQGCTTKPGGRLAGEVQGRDAALGFRQTDGTLGSLSLHASKSGKHLTGSYVVTHGTCEGTQGVFHATLVHR